MRIRGCTVEYNLDEAAKMLGISPDELERAVEEGSLQYFYRSQSKVYRFHEASVLTNQELLAQREFPFRSSWRSKEIREIHPPHTNRPKSNRLHQTRTTAIKRSELL